MSIESALYEFLIGKPTLTAIFGERIYPFVPDEQAERLSDTGAAQTYMVITYVSARHEHRQAGTCGVEHQTVQFDIFADSSVDAKTAAAELRTVLVFRGLMGTEKLDVRSVELIDEGGSIEQPRDGGERGLYRRTLEYEIGFRTGAAADWAAA